MYTTNCTKICKLPNINRFIKTGTFLLLALFILKSCEQNFDPFEDGEAAFSVYGSLSIDQTPNYIRIKDLHEAFIEDSTYSYNYDVTFENLTNDTTYALRDTIIDFGGLKTHNLILDDLLKPKRKYRITIENDDGAKTQSIATTPGIAEPEVIPEGAGCYDTIQIRFENVVKPEQLHVELGFPFDEGIYRAHISGSFSEFHHNEEKNVWYIEGTMRNLLKYAFPPTGDGPPCSQPPAVWCWNLDSDEIQVDYYHLGPEWESEYRVEESRSPIEAPDVDGGLGFFGAYAKGSFSFRIDTTQ